MRRRATFFLLLAFSLATSLTSGACSANQDISLDGKDIFFNSHLVAGILDVAEADRATYLKQYNGKEIQGRAKLISVHDTMPEGDTPPLGKYEMLAQSPNVFKDIDVEYRIYVDTKTGLALYHKRVVLSFSGSVKKVEWIKEGDERSLRVYLAAEKVEPLE